MTKEQITPRRRSQLAITPDNYKDLKKHYDKAVKDGKESFHWKGQEVLTSYAYYLLEYMSSVIKS